MSPAGDGYTATRLSSRSRVHATTVVAVLVAAVLTLSYGFVAVQAFLAAADPDRLDPAFERSALGLASGQGGTATTASGIIGLVIGAVVLVSSIVVVGLAFRRQWAREAAFGVYGVLGLVATAISVGGLLSDPPAPSAWVGVLTGVANIAVVGLLLVPATARDFAAGERARSRGR